MSEIKSLITGTAFASNIAKRTGSEPVAQRFVKMFETAVYKNPKLLNCTKESILISAYHLAELNLCPVPSMGHAYLIPYKDNRNNITVCNLQIGWRGLCELALRNKDILSITSEVVYKGDEFDVYQGTNSSLNHRINLNADRTDPNIIGVYAMARFANGSSIFEVMSKSQIDNIRDKFSKTDAQKGATPWQTSYSEMARKTVVKRLTKYLPFSTEVALAMEIDNLVYDYPTIKETTRNPIEALKDRINPIQEAPIDINMETGEVLNPQGDVENGTSSDA